MLSSKALQILYIKTEMPLPMGVYTHSLLVIFVSIALFLIVAMFPNIMSC